MKSRFNFCGNVERCPKVLSFGKTQIHLVFRSLTCTLATTFMVATAITIVSCSQDDDDYNSDMYTLAEKMETRSGGDPGTNPDPTSQQLKYIETLYDQSFTVGGFTMTGHIRLTYTIMSPSYTDLTCSGIYLGGGYHFTSQIDNVSVDDSKVSFYLTLTPVDNNDGNVTGSPISLGKKTIKKDKFKPSN